MICNIFLSFKILMNIYVYIYIYIHLVCVHVYIVCIYIKSGYMYSVYI